MSDWGSSKAIRVIALGCLRRENEILVHEGFDRVKNENFFRMLGGGIEVMEMAEDAVCREFLEEIGLEVAWPKFIGVLENIFQFEGQDRHEYAHIFECGFVDESNYKKEFFPIVENGVAVGNAVWKRLPFLLAEETRFYPAGMKELLKKYETSI